VLAALFVLMLAAAQAPAASSASPAQGEVVAAIQVHGNTLTPDDDIRRLAAIEVGAPFDTAALDAAARRLRETGRFETVQVLKRFASIDDPRQVLVVVLVDEGRVDIQRTNDPDRPVRVVRASGPRVMFLPVLNAEDGYGLTYGVRFATVDPVGRKSRLAFPVTWGGNKRAAVELETTPPRGLLDRVVAGAAVSRRTNPFFEADDDRVRVWVRGERQVVKWLRAGAVAGWQRTSFLDAVERFGHAGADVTIDTRADPVLPRNAIFGRASFERIAGADRWDLDGRGYVGLVGQTILAVRAAKSDSDGPLLPNIKPLLGGMSTLRGFGAGAFAGDTVVSTSAELVVPLTSPISFGRIGTSVFMDAGAAYDDGERLSAQTWKRGIGGSVWFSAAFLRLDIAVAHGRGASTHLHVGANLTF
jgi:hypothetical protein